MKKLILKLTLGVMVSFAGISASAQCPTIACPSNITVNNDPGNCDAIVTYALPTGNDPCNSVAGSQTFNYTGTIDTWTVPVGVTAVTIETRGASGGNSGASAVGPGLGAIMRGDFSVTPGATLKILVGENNNAGNGGGGGTFVTTNTNLAIIVAGGGGGAGQGADSPEKHGKTTQNGGTGSGGGGTGGTSGNGGNIGASFASGAGGGLLTDGTDGWTVNSGGDAFVNGGAGANVGFGIGGFGGGGNGSGNVVGGGAGGYSGGGGASNSAGGGVGGGGGSLNSGTNQTNTAGVHSGNGQVIITWNIPGPVTIAQTLGLASGSTFPVGATTNTFTATDAFSNVVSCSFTVTVVDAENPTITCPGAITINTDAGQCTSTASIGTATGTDNCGSPTITNNAPASFPIGNTTVTWTATDGASNTITCTQVVTVVDAENPTIICPGAITINTDAGQCTSTASIGTATGTDNCGSPTITNNAPASFPIGNTTVTWTSTDGASNTTTCTQVVTVVDAEAPIISCPANITVSNDAGMCDAVVTYTAPVGTDNCTGATTAMTAGLASGATFPVGVTTVTYTVTDAANNIDSCSFTVTVVDTTLPTVTCPANVASCDPLVNGIAPTTADNCTGETVAYTLTGATTGSGSNDASGTTFNVGTTTVQYVVTDASNNQDSCSFDVTINPLPTVAIAAFSPDTVCVTDPAFVLPVGTPAAGTYSGNGVSGANFDPNAAGIGAHYVVYTFTDGNSCTNMDSTMIVVQSCVGINETNALSGVNIYPNPTNNVINVSLGNITTAVSFTLTSIDGKVVYQANNINDNKAIIDISNNAKGVYFLKIETNNKQQIFKVIKQ